MKYATRIALWLLNTLNIFPPGSDSFTNFLAIKNMYVGEKCSASLLATVGKNFLNDNTQY